MDDLSNKASENVLVLLKKIRFIYSALFNIHNPNKIIETVKLFETVNYKDQKVIGISVDCDDFTVSPAYDEKGEEGFWLRKQIGIEFEDLEKVTIGVYTTEERVLRSLFTEFTSDFLEGLISKLSI